ncbi:MAG: hypothetical protein F6K22_27485 [Okeania sp. SIO2F4]|uniref:hypothetical protein n=1 Tax=Okeania sp. SIO2F4 TaxID=2607790 RepID=UPI00142A737F|nr:hypothetical protein [Okeania sp. SIO2F4]NES06224.1 hypothetical protein [Okeania sp. SIO2F4]
MDEKITVDAKNVLALSIARELCVEGLLDPNSEMAYAARNLNKEEFRTYLAVAVDLKIRLLPDERKQSIIFKLAVPDK